MWVNQVSRAFLHPTPHLITHFMSHFVMHGFGNKQAQNVAFSLCFQWQVI